MTAIRRIANIELPLSEAEDTWEGPFGRREGLWMDSGELLLDGLRGAYIPQKFAEIYGKEWNIPQEDMEILSSGPDHPDYQSTWDFVVTTALLMTDRIYALEEDEEGNLFKVKWGEV